jgi:choline-sulfatase
MIGLRNERYKLTLCEADPPILADLEADPYEMTNLAEDPAASGIFEALSDEASKRWDLSRFDAAVRESQARRHIVYAALRNGAYFPWDYQPLQKASERYMRNHMDLNILEESQRFPRGE